MAVNATNLRAVGKRRVKLDAYIEIDDDGTRHLVIEGGRLFGAAEVADALGVRVQNLHTVRNLIDPVAWPRATRIWLESEIGPFAATQPVRHLSRPRQPRKKRSETKGKTK